MKHELKRIRELLMIIITCTIVLALVTGYYCGYQQGVQYQKEQPVNVSISAYAGANVITSDIYPMTQVNTIGMGTQTHFVQAYNITQWEVHRVP